MLVLSSLVAAALCTPAVSSAQAPTPMVQGNHLIDSTTGAVWVPRGANWPSFAYACQQGWGYSSDGADAATGAAMAEWHINAVRIPLNQDCWLGDDGLPSNPGGSASGYRAAVKQFSDALQSAGIVPILDLHWTGPDGVVADGLRAMPDDRTDDFWSSVAAAYKDDRSVMFDAFNEPYSRVDPATGFDFTLTWDCWNKGGISCGAGAPAQHDLQSPFDGHRFVVTGMAALVQAVRSAGANQPIMLGGLEYANDLTGWLANRPDDAQLVASFHTYQFNRCKDARCWDAEIAPVARTVPVVTGEFGETDCTDTHVKAYMTWADAHDVGYLAWAWWAPDSPSDGSPACSELALLNADGTARFPNGTALKDHLANLAAANPRDPQPASTVPMHPVQVTKDSLSSAGGGGAVGRERDARARLAVLDERAWIPRELRDSVAHTVSVMVLQAGGAEQVLASAPDRARTAARAVETKGRDALGELHELLGVLHDDDDTSPRAPQPSLTDLETLINTPPAPDSL
jgi:hypothetical protein